ncbi:hypothetical protein [Flammeovirga sp. SJP92]|uniref:hypothetical protein n=1 Tax=Flammeovirga sp. SJP92 TaxID=1775430 RepID=UPI0007883F4A|nr:hypothetical protein [Flammeovirga sp. SJP92]KXX72656.1 hypothetical protein AVL50_06545 [Flammeovirga sp. SJP92]
MKNIWKNAILFLSLIGLMTFVSSCGSSDDPVEEPTDVVFNLTGFENNAGVEMSVDGITATVSGTNVTIAGIPEGTTGLMPTTMKNGTQAIATFVAGFTDVTGDFANPTSTVTLVYEESTSRVKETPAKFTYTFSKQ